MSRLISVYEIWNTISKYYGKHGKLGRDLPFSRDSFLTIEQIAKSWKRFCNLHSLSRDIPDEFPVLGHAPSLWTRSYFVSPSHAIQDICDRIQRGYKLFWENLKNKRKTAPPKFKSWRKYRSLSYNMVGRSIIKGNVIKIAGGKYKFPKSRDIEGTIKLLTVKRDACGDFFVYLICDTPLLNTWHSL